MALVSSFTDLEACNHLLKRRNQLFLDLFGALIANGELSIFCQHRVALVSGKSM